MEKNNTRVSKLRKPLKWYVDEYGCWICTSHSKPNGYPALVVNGITCRGNRFVYEQCFGAIPEGMVVRHKCDTRACINPEHLEVGTYKENSEDCKRRHRMHRPSGEKHHNSKLTVQALSEIYAADKSVKSAMLAEKFGVSRDYITNIRRGRQKWKDVSTITKTEKERIHVPIA